MQILEQAVAAIRQHSARGRVDGARLATSMEAVMACGDRAARLWQGYLDNPGAPGDQYTLMSWIGADRAKQLHEQSLLAHEHVTAICAAAGDQARFLVLDESPIVLAYAGLKEGQTGIEAAQAMLAAQLANNKRLHALADYLRSINSTPAKAVTPAAARKSVAKKPVSPGVKTKKAVKKKAPGRKTKAKKGAQKAPKKK